MIGETLNQYRIAATIGTGEVFRARDTRLNRDVAVNWFANFTDWQQHKVQNSSSHL